MSTSQPMHSGDYLDEFALNEKKRHQLSASVYVCSYLAQQNQREHVVRAFLPDGTLGRRSRIARTRQTRRPPMAASRRPAARNHSLRPTSNTGRRRAEAVLGIWLGLMAWLRPRDGDHRLPQHQADRMPTSFFKLAVAGLAACAAASVPAAPEYPTTHTVGVPFSKDEAWYRQCMRVEHAAPVTTTRRSSA